jgi:hypothetical protein
MASANHQRGRRIQSHERESNDNAVILGANESYLNAFKNEGIICNYMPTSSVFDCSTWRMVTWAGSGFVLSDE